MEEIAGTYRLTYIEIARKSYDPDSFLSSSLKAEIYEADGQWFFDAVYPVFNYHGAVDYHDLIFPLTWDQVLCRYVFYAYPEEQDRLKIESIVYQDGEILVSTGDPEFFSKYRWSK